MDNTDGSGYEMYPGLSVFIDAHHHSIQRHAQNTLVYPPLTASHTDGAHFTIEAFVRSRRRVPCESRSSRYRFVACVDAVIDVL